MQAKILVLILSYLVILKIDAQTKGSTYPVTYFIYDKSFNDSSFNNLGWSYCAHVMEHDSCSYSEAKPSDTLKCVHTARINSDSQYSHVVRFCDAEIKNGMLKLTFKDMTVSSYDDLTVYITNGRYRSNYNTQYMNWEANQGLYWICKKQKLILNNNIFKKGQEIRGSLKIEFLEAKKNSDYSRTITLEGMFKTVIK